jgi:hypothetical protein
LGFEAVGGVVEMAEITNVDFEMAWDFLQIVSSTFMIAEYLVWE